MSVDQHLNNGSQRNTKSSRNRHGGGLVVVSKTVVNYDNCFIFSIIFIGLWLTYSYIRTLLYFPLQFHKHSAIDECLISPYSVLLH